MTKVSQPLPKVQKFAERGEHYQRAEELGGWCLEPVGDAAAPDFAVLWTYHQREGWWDEEPRYSAHLLEWEPEARRWVVAGWSELLPDGSRRWRGYVERFAEQAPPLEARTWIGEQLLERKRCDDAARARGRR